MLLRLAATLSRTHLLPIAFLLVATSVIAAAGNQWPRWAGPNQDFTCQTAALADKWPADGPKKLWSREIGPGHSSIVVDGDMLVTMCRRGEQDAVLALDAKTGETLWETRYDAPTRPNMSLEFGPGPHSTPLIAGDRIFAAGAMTHFHCLDKRTGKILWSHDLNEELGASYLLRGYGASPIAYQDTVIVPVGGRGPDAAGLVAFKQATGEIAWKSEKFPGGYPTPVIVKCGGEDHLVIALGGVRAALDPATGTTRWRVDVDRQSAAIMASPLWIPPDRVFFSAAYGGGSRLFKISKANGKYAAEELWHCRKLKIHHANAIRIGDVLYGSSGDFGPAFLMALDLNTGKVLWRKRGFAKSTLLLADGKLIILDEQGNLTLATASGEGLEVHSQVELLQDKSWTIPTLVGTRLYLRDNHKIMALTLPAG